MRSPAWMAAYALTLVLLGATYGTLVLTGPKVALLFALAALAAVLAATALAFFR
jgi:hypothetical protein